MTDPAGRDGDRTSGHGSAETADHLDALREEVDRVDQLPVGERVAIFERVNDGVAAELARLDEA